MTKQYLTVQQIAADVTERLKVWPGTQAEFAKSVGVAPSYISMLLNGRHTIGPQILEGLGYDPTPRYARVTLPPSHSETP